MADAPVDRFAQWQISLREALKWYVASLSGLAALLTGGLTFAILPDLEGDRLRHAAILAAMVLGLILLALWLVIRVLAVKPLNYDRLKKQWLLKQLDPYMSEMNGHASFAGLEKALAQAKAKTPPVFGEIKGLKDDRARAIGLAAYLDLRRRIFWTHLWLLLIFVGVILGSGGIAYLHGKAKAGSDGDKVAVRFLPGEGWQGYGAALAQSCGMPPDGLAAKGVADKPFSGWWTLTLDGPNCKGVTLAVPGAVIGNAP